MARFIIAPVSGRSGDGKERNVEFVTGRFGRNNAAGGILAISEFIQAPSLQTRVNETTQPQQPACARRV
jgi:hypothetical protein